MFDKCLHKLTEFCHCIAGDSELSETLDKCLLCMHVEAIWQVKVQPDCDFCLEESEHKSVPPSPAAILYELELLSFTKVQSVYTKIKPSGKRDSQVDASLQNQNLHIDL